ncbi:MAG: hypothetical protein JWO93_2431 [Micrococcaceae bacterium]|nr:hypothetical protein [Micrococcaceae bacterium]
MVIRRGPVLIQFLLLAVTWGASFLFIKVGLEGLSAAQVVWGRLIAGALVLGVICALTRRPLPSEPVVWAHLLVVSVLLCVAPFLLFAWAEQHITSGLASIYNATTPLMTMVFAWAALPAERPTLRRLAGLLTGFVGVALILAPWRGQQGSSLNGQLACLGATACYGIAFVYLRKFVSPRGLHAVSVATVQVGLGAALMLILTPVITVNSISLTPRVVAAVLTLGVAGTGLAYVWNNNVVAAWGATNASTVTYLAPVVGVLLGTFVLHERLGWSEPIGAAVVILGLTLSQDRLNPRLWRLRRASRFRSGGPHHLNQERPGHTTPCPGHRSPYGHTPSQCR